MNNTEKILEISQGFNFDLIGIIPVKPSADSKYLKKWLAEEFAGEMSWIEKGKDKRLNPQNVFPESKSLIVVGVNYYFYNLPAEIRNDPSRGIIARYAWLPDYHKLILKKLEEFGNSFSEILKQKVNYKAYVDTGPILERELANQAGLGFIGNNTNLINNRLGSYFFLGAIFLDVALKSYIPKTIGSCGTCQKCINNCPTGAIVDKKVLDARKCISYLTIELKDEIPEKLRPLMKNRIFGCDICQEVCPWNSKAKPSSFFDLEIDETKFAPSLLELAELSEEAFRERFQGTPVLRAKYQGFMRNVAVALGNWRDKKALPALKLLSQSSNPIVKNHAIWAKKQILI